MALYEKLDDAETQSASDAHRMSHDVEEIFEYIASDALETAVELLDKFDASILHFESFLEMGTVAKNRRLANKGYRLLVIEGYLVFYVVLGDKVEIRRIVSGKKLCGTTLMAK